MENKIQFKRGDKAKLPLLSQGEPGFCIDTNELYIGNTNANIKILGENVIVNNLKGGKDKVLSAEQGRILNNKITDSMTDDYLNLKKFQEDYNISIENGWSSVLDRAISYAISPGVLGTIKTIFIPNGEYNLNYAIWHTNPGEFNLNIIGESCENTILKFKEDGIKFQRTDDIVIGDYSSRIVRVSISNLTIRKQNNDKKGIGLMFNGFGFIKLDNVRIRGFEKGLYLRNGSEFDGYNLHILGNEVGIYLSNPIAHGKSTDLANINFYSARIHNNSETMLIDNCREVNFYGSVLMNYTSGITCNGITNLISFDGCDFENQDDTSDFFINSTGTFNFKNCSFNNPKEKKIICNSDATLNFVGTLIQGDALKTIHIKGNANPRINMDKIYLGYYTESLVDYSNFTKPQLININNDEFQKGCPLPMGVNHAWKVDKSNYITSNCSLAFDPNTTQKIISLNYTTIPSVRATYVEVIAKNLPTNNPLMIYFDDGTNGFNFKVGGGDSIIQDYGNGFKKYAFKLPNHRNKKIKSIALTWTNTKSIVYIDSIKFYGTGSLENLYADVKPVVGQWEIGDRVYPKFGKGVEGSNVVESWICTQNSSTTNNVFKSLTLPK